MNGMEACQEVMDSLADRALRCGAMEAAVPAEIEGKTAGCQPNEDFRTMRESVHSVFAILKVRARELLARAAAPERWERFEAAASG